MMLKLTQILMGALMCFSLVPVMPQAAYAEESTPSHEVVSSINTRNEGLDNNVVQDVPEGFPGSPENPSAPSAPSVPFEPPTTQPEGGKLPSDEALSDDVFGDQLEDNAEIAPPAGDVPGDKAVSEEVNGIAPDDVSEIALFTARAANGIKGINVVTNKNSSKPLDVAAGSTEDYANVQQYDENNTPAQRFSVEPAGDGYYYLVNVNSGKALDVSAASKKPGANVQQYALNKTAAQKWMFVPVTGVDGCYYIVSALVGGKEDLTGALVLDVGDASKANGANVQVYTYNGTEAQQFSFEQKRQTITSGVYQMRTALDPSTVLDIAGSSNDNYGNAQIYTANGTYAQKFVLTYNDKTGYYAIQNAYSARALDVSGASNVNGANVQQYLPNNTNAQKWSIESVSDGGYRLRSGCSGLVLDVSGGNSRNGTNVQVWQSNSTGAQKWYFYEAKLLSEGTFEVKSALGTTLDAVSGGVSPGTNIQTYATNGTMAQKYYLYGAGDGYYRLEAMKSGLAVGLMDGAGPNVCLVANTGADSQLWKPVIAGGGQFYLLNKETGKVLDIYSGSSASGANVWTYEKNDSSAQKWYFAPTNPVTEAQYTISSALDAKKVLDIPAASTSNGAKLQIYDSNKTPAQMFKVVGLGGGYYRIVNMGSNKSLDVAEGKINASTGSGDVQQWDSNYNVAQKWKFEYAGNGFYALISAVADESYCLDVLNASTANNNPIIVYRSNGSSAQKFKLSEISGISYVQYDISLSDMAKYQKEGNKYLSLPAGSRDIPLSEITTALDPSNSSGSSFFQFADLRVGTGLLGSQLNAYIATSGRGGVLEGKGSAFALAATTYGLNEAYLVAHTCVESGWGKSRLAKGTYYNGSQYEYIGKDGKPYIARLSGYPAGTYYNLFGIGAVDSDPHKYGVEKAIKEGWSTVDAAINGSAKWIANSYVYASSYPQATLYEMKWDVARSSGTKQYGWHQYATDIQWAKTIARLMGECYVSAGVPSPSVVYRVPSYK